MGFPVLAQILRLWTEKLQRLLMMALLPTSKGFASRLLSPPLVTWIVPWIP
jgi:hypothetical protein